MDTLNHIAWGYTMTHVLGAPVEINVISGLIGGMPDLLGEAERIIKKDRTLWNWYSKAHNQCKWLRVIPQWGFHIIKDKATHGKNRWWIWKERLWFEVLSWLLLLWVWIAPYLESMLYIQKVMLTYSAILLLTSIATGCIIRDKEPLPEY